MDKEIDSIQKSITDFAYALAYEDIPAEAVHAAKMRIIDTLGALIAGFFAEPCRIARNLAAKMPCPDGATIIGTRAKTTVDMAAFVNSTTARFPEMIDTYHSPGSSRGHASDTITPLLGVAEYAQRNGRDFITSVVLSYEIFLRISDAFHNESFDPTNFGCISTAVATSKLLGLSSEQLGHSIALAVVPNVILKRMRTGHLSMFKAAASGCSGRAGVFSALMAAEGMDGAHLPFEGQAGWCELVAVKPFVLDSFADKSGHFKVMDTQIKVRPCDGASIGCILAAEKISPLNIKEVKHVTVSTYKHAKEVVGSGHGVWHPDSRETADHSIPYVIAATLIDGTVTQRSFNDAHLWNPELRALMQKIEVVADEEITNAYNSRPQRHLARVVVELNNGERLVGESGGDENDLASPKTDTQIEEKFETLTEETLGSQQVRTILDCLWHLDQVKNINTIPPLFVLA